jgi:hypothetical protein
MKTPVTQVWVVMDVTCDGIVGAFTDEGKAYDLADLLVQPYVEEFTLDEMPSPTQDDGFRWKRKE